MSMFLMKCLPREEQNGSQESRKVTTGYLARYAALVTDSSKGAMLSGSDSIDIGREE